MNQEIEEEQKIFEIENEKKERKSKLPFFNQNIEDAQREYEEKLLDSTEKIDSVKNTEKLENNNAVISDQTIDLRKTGSYREGQVLHSLTGFTKTSMRTAANIAYGSSTQGTEAKAGIDQTLEYYGMPAALIVAEAQKRVSNAMSSTLESDGTLASYHQLVAKYGEDFIGTYTVIGISSVKDLEKMQDGLNQILQKEGLPPIRCSKTNMSRALTAYMDKYGKLLEEKGLTDILSIMKKAKQNEFVMKANGAKAYVRRGLGRRMRRYLQQTEVGEGSFFTIDLISRSKSTLKAALTGILKVAQFAQLIALKAEKTAAWATVKSAMKATSVAATGKIQKMFGVPEKSPTISSQPKKNRLRTAKERGKNFLRDPFHLRMRTQRMSKKITDKIIRSKIGKPIRLMGRVFSPIRIIGNVAGKTFIVLSNLVTLSIQIIVIMLLLGVGILLLVYIVTTLLSSLMSLFDFTANEEEIKIAALEQIQESYTQQMETLQRETSGFRKVTYNYVDIKTESSYAENKPEYAFTETTNSAEMLSMASVYFDFDLEGAGKRKVKEYLRKLYNGSHVPSIITHVYTYVDENGDPYTVTDAEVTLTTYYFDELFECSLQDNFGTLSGTEISEQVWNYFRSAGFTEEATAGIMGNLMAESGMDPTVIQNGGAGPAAGITQWENYNLGTERWKALSDYAASQGKPWTDLKCQLDFILIEMPEQFRLYTGNGIYVYPNGAEAWWPDPVTVTQYKALTSVETATEIYERVFTRASIPAMQQRIEYAYSYYNMYKGMEASSDTAQKIIDTAYEQLGKPYEFGATGPDSFDCSGLVQYCYAQAGISIPRTAKEQAENGIVVYTPEPGDICYTTDHVGIYIGNNQMIEAQQDGVPICISEVRAESFIRYE